MQGESFVLGMESHVSNRLMKVLDPACQCLQQLINALDKFDSMSKRGCPPPSVCRRVVECCRDNVAMFGQLTPAKAMKWVWFFRLLP